MTDNRREWDARLRERAVLQKVAADLGLEGNGKHFFCPGCQPKGGKTPELAMQDGGFHCFQCGAQGDLVGLVKLAHRCDLDAALTWLARETGEEGTPGENA